MVDFLKNLFFDENGCMTVMSIIIWILSLIYCGIDVFVTIRDRLRSWKHEQ